MLAHAVLAGGAAFQRRKKLSLAGGAHACLKCSICSPAWYGTADTVCNTPSTGPTGGAPTNSWPSSTTTENENLPCLSAFDFSYLSNIYNCSIRNAFALYPGRSLAEN